MIAVAQRSQKIDLEVSCFIRTRDNAKFLAIRRELLLEMVRMVEEAGTSLAAPGRTHYLRERKLDQDDDRGEA